ncbi:MAG: hypothetical protein ACOYWZ_13200 [Bacillota bacterium]
MYLTDNNKVAKIKDLCKWRKSEIVVEANIKEPFTVDGGIKIEDVVVTHSEEHENSLIAHFDIYLKCPKCGVKNIIKSFSSNKWDDSFKK